MVIDEGLYRHLWSQSREGLLLLQGRQLLRSNALGLRTFRAPGCRRGEQWVPWLELQLNTFLAAGQPYWQGLYQRPSGHRIWQYQVWFERFSDQPRTLLVRSRYLGTVDLRGETGRSESDHEQQLRLILDTTLVGKLLLSEEGQVLYANPRAAMLFDRDPSELVGQYLGLPLELGQVNEVDIPSGGHLRTAEISLIEVPWQRGSAYLATLSDVTERNRSREELQVLRQAWEQSPVALVITDADANIEFVNQAFEAVSGYSLAEVRGRNPHLLASGETSPRTYEEMWRKLQQGKAWRGEFRNRRKSGESYWEAATIAPVRNAVGDITHYVGVKEDITLRKHTEEQLRIQANYDALTGLPNRSFALRLLESTLLLQQRRRSQLAVLFLDLDRFKQVNDQAGHQAGDRLLQQVAGRLRHCLRQHDTVARQSGDEFLILCPDLEGALAAELVAERVIRIFEEPILIDQRAFQVGCSIGISLYPDEGTDPELLLRQADQAMYVAKRQGGNTFRFFTRSMNEQVQQRLKIEALLRRAIDREEMTVAYQPIVRLRDQTVVGAEALLRWFSPDLGSVSPELFVAIAEETGQINRIGNWVLEQAVAFVRGVQHRLPGVESLWVSVNLSPRQIRQPGLRHEILSLLERSGLPHPQLKLEVTEQMLMEDEGSSSTLLHDLCQQGIQLAIDDFGTGYSSLGYLRQFPFRILKIDRSFIRDVPHQRDACILVRTVLAMAEELGLQVVAEGIETQEQLNFLRRYGCPYGQGFLLGRPCREIEFHQQLQQPSAAASLTSLERGDQGG